LIADLSHHAGLLVRNAQLTVDLQQELEVVSARAEELERSRQAVVVAQDRQRRRLERDIHDGAQQQLVALLVMLRGRLRRRQVDGGSATRVDDLRSVLESPATPSPSWRGVGRPPCWSRQASRLRSRRPRRELAGLVQRSKYEWRECGEAVSRPMRRCTSAASRPC
jgi:hypothetical protein